jgi:glycosyltransferase involved in cell wall biosynthesis
MADPTSGCPVREDELDVSVVIATRNRETRLRFALEALRAQTLDPSRFEVIVVRADDVSGQLTEPPPGLHVTLLGCRPNPAAQRNTGWRVARGRLVAFTDDDCRPPPRWLESYLAAADGGTAILQGPTRPDPDEVHLLHGRARSIEITEPDEWYPTCNIAYPRSLLDRVGGFDERFPAAWGEDTDLGLRARAAGAELRFVEDALNYHAVNARTLKAALREAVRRDSLPMVFARHPGQRRILFMRTFVRRTHANFVLAVLGVGIIRRWPLLGLLAMLPYLRNRRPLTTLPRSLPQILYHLPARALVDAVEVAAVARAAVKHRVPVL